MRLGPGWTFSENVWPGPLGTPGGLLAPPYPPDLPDPAPAHPPGGPPGPLPATPRGVPRGVPNASFSTIPPPTPREAQKWPFLGQKCSFWALRGPSRRSGRSREGVDKDAKMVIFGQKMAIFEQNPSDLEKGLLPIDFLTFFARFLGKKRRKTRKKREVTGARTWRSLSARLGGPRRYPMQKTMVFSTSFSYGF